ncbi:hypothetical protein YC2023_005084 [Brassica napus]
MVLIFHSCKGFSDLEDFWVSRLKYNALGDFQDDLPGSLLTESSHMSPFHNRFERFDGSHLPLRYVLRFGADIGRFMGSLLRSLLKYNALEDFSKIFWKTSRKSYGRLLGSLMEDFSEVF